MQKFGVVKFNSVSFSAYNAHIIDVKGLGMDILNKIAVLEKEAENFGFAWEESKQIMAQIKAECEEIEEHLSHATTDARRFCLQEEIGDLLHATFSLCIFCKLDPKDTLKNTTEKFERRLNAVKQITHEKKLSSLKDKTFDELMSIWGEAKQRVG